MTNPFPADDRSNRERMLAGELYSADDPELAQDSRRAVELAAAYRQAFEAGDPDAAALLTQLLGHVGEGAEVRPPLHVDYGTQISIGARCFINYGLTALDVAPIVIGDDCQIGPNVQLLTPTHPLDPQQRLDKLEGAKPITLGNNVWLGGGVIVNPGVSIGENTVVGSGAVVTRDLPANVVAVGNPARVVRGL